ncbi:hypothetical protein GCM10018963_65660 [Saccharothrix longispora]
MWWALNTRAVSPGPTRTTRTRNRGGGAQVERRVHLGQHERAQLLLVGDLGGHHVLGHLVEDLLLGRAVGVDDAGAQRLVPRGHGAHGRAQALLVHVPRDAQRGVHDVRARVQAEPPGQPEAALVAGQRHDGPGRALRHGPPGGGGQAALREQLLQQAFAVVGQFGHGAVLSGDGDGASSATASGRSSTARSRGRDRA